MKPAAAALSTLALLLACNGDPPEQTGTSTATTDTAATTTTDASSTTAAPTTTVTATATATATDSATDGATDGTTTSESTTDQGDCRVIDCAPGFTCVDGACVPVPGACISPMLTIPLDRAAMLLVVDKSGSMLTLWDSDDDPKTPDTTRWRSLHNVVVSLTDTFADSVDLGLQLYPSVKATAKLDPSACLVEGAPEAPIAPMNTAAILNKLPAAGATSAIAGGTPARKALISALTHLKELPGERPKFITFITDGAANCSPEAEAPLDLDNLFETYDHQLLDLVAQAGVGIIVVGIDIKNEVSPKVKDGDPDNTNTFEELSALAIAGGYPSPGGFPFFYNATNENELLEVLTQILGQFQSCQFTVDPVPGADDIVQVLLNDDIFIPNEPTCDGDGWVFAKPDRSEIRLCGGACAGAQQGATVTVEYNCPSKKPLDPPPSECDIWGDDCPAGQKCVPYASDGFDTWSAAKCVPLAPDPKKPGEACTVMIDKYSGLDDCDRQAWCSDEDDDLSGTCVPMCVNQDAPMCPIGTGCTSWDQVLNICVPGCNPLADECGGDLCLHNAVDLYFTCQLPSEDVPLFGECMWFNACAAGLQCVIVDGVAPCGDAFGCCLPYCDLSAPGACPDPLECVPIYDPGQAPPGFEDVGECLGA